MTPVQLELCAYLTHNKEAPWQSNNRGLWVTEASITPWQALKEGFEIRIHPEAGDWPEDYKDENGKYMNKCFICLNTFLGNKHRQFCKLCAFDPIPGVKLEYLTTQLQKTQDYLIDIYNDGLGSEVFPTNLDGTPNPIFEFCKLLSLAQKYIDKNKS